jgi:hemerythrin
LNILYDIRVAGAGIPEIAEQLNIVLSIVSHHFAHEENEMLAKKFVGYVAHKAEHFDLIATCTALQLKIEAGDLELTERICQLIKSWFDSHIPEYDRAYAQILNSPPPPAKLVVIM